MPRRSGRNAPTIDDAPIGQPANAAGDVDADAVDAPPQNTIQVRGARTHNLRNIDVDLPHNRFVVITGVSGSGKSSLAFDTIFAEGQRRYLDSLSAYTRQFLDQMERPDVDEIQGLPPTLSIEQHAGTAQPRSTLATTTGIYDFLRLLYARAGTAHCYQCGQPVSRQSVAAIVDTILALDDGRKVMILAPLVQGRKGTHRELFDKIVRDGFVRARVDGQVIDAAAPPELKKSKPHTIELIIDRIVVKAGLRQRLHESVELALKHGTGTCLISEQAGEGWHDRLFSSEFACPRCQLSFPAIEPRTFSFNSPYGACPACEGLGTVPAVAADTSLISTAPTKRVAADEPMLDGAEESANRVVCPVCAGARLGPLARHVTVAEVPIQDVVRQTVAEAAEQFKQLQQSLAIDVTEVAAPTDMSANTPAAALARTFTPPARLVADKLLPEITSRLRFLMEVGLDYLTLDRPTETLSGGEFQRARLAGCLGSGLTGVCYVLDEPTIGLHPRDTGRLLQSLQSLRDQANSVLIVEHDLDVIRAADEVLDLGPGAGREGGRVIAQGTPAELANTPESLTGRYLRADHPLQAALHAPARPVDLSQGLTIEHATARNLQDVSATIPLQALVCVTGVSGSGKSSLIMETLSPLVRAALLEQRAGQGRGRDNATASTTSPALPQLAAARVIGVDRIDRLVEIDQSPIGRTPRSIPATAAGVWDDIRRVFARTREARVRGFTATRFSFNAAPGRCAECRGRGVQRVAMHFLPDLEVICPVCRGARFNRPTLQVRFRGRTIADVLQMRFDEACEFFENFAGLRQRLQTFVDVGLGYLTLGQSARTLSGGEAQRIKLATELSQPGIGRTLFVLDEPTTGLHLADIDRLLHVLRQLVAQGHSVVVIEHQLEMIAAADWVIDLGPEGGAGGGRVIATGTPTDISNISASHTGQALQRLSGN